MAYQSAACKVHWGINVHFEDKYDDPQKEGTEQGGKNGLLKKKKVTLFHKMQGPLK